jgi:hypothetical protein
MSEKRWEEQCLTCHGRRYGRLDMADGRYQIDLPSRCETKDACEIAMLKGSVPTRDDAGEIIRP